MLIAFRIRVRPTQYLPLVVDPDVRRDDVCMRLNTFAYLTDNFACNFAHERSEYVKKSVGLLLHLQMPVGRPSRPCLPQRKRAILYSYSLSLSSIRTFVVPTLYSVGLYFRNNVLN